jgi:TolB-like protein
MEGKLKKKNFRKRNIVVSLSIILLAVAAFIIYKKFFERNNDAGIDKSIAVLPFVDMSAGKDQEYFSDGLSEKLLNLLSKISELKVISRTSSFSFKGKNEDLRSIAQKLGVAHILEGSVREDGNKIRVTFQLIRATDGSHLWSETYDRDVAAVFKLQDAIVGAVVKQLKLKLLPPTAKTDAASINTESYKLMLQGNYFA